MLAHCLHAAVMQLKVVQHTQVHLQPYCDHSPHTGGLILHGGAGLWP